MLVRSDALSAGVRKWNQKFDDLNWKNIYRKCFETTIDTQLRWFQVRLKHRILPTGEFLFLRKIKKLHHCLPFAVTAVLKVVIIESMSVSSLVYDGERCKPPAYHSMEGFQHVESFQLFEVKLESCVLWLADFFQAKAEGQQVVITSNV